MIWAMLERIRFFSIDVFPYLIYVRHQLLVISIVCFVKGSYFSKEINSSQKYVQNCCLLCPTSINERRQALGSWLKGDQVCTSVWSPSTSCPCCKSSPHQPQESRPPPSRVKTTNLRSQVTALNQNITV